MSNKLSFFDLIACCHDYYYINTEETELSLDELEAVSGGLILNDHNKYFITEVMRDYKSRCRDKNEQEKTKGQLLEMYYDRYFNKRIPDKVLEAITYEEFVDWFNQTWDSIWC